MPTYNVTVDRTAVRSLTIEVKADTEVEAKEKAIELACSDYDFYSEGTEGGVEYTADEIEVITRYTTSELQSKLTEYYSTCSINELVEAYNAINPFGEKVGEGDVVDDA